jgi:D-methionine transport system substrate-binding protein
MNSLLKKSLIVAAIASLCVFAAGCGGNSSDKGAAAPQKKEIKVGVTAGPHAEVMDEVKKEAAKQGINIKVVEFNDYVQPDTALANGDLDMNSMQHQPYLDNMVKKQGLKLTSIGKSIVVPMGIYSKKFTALDAVTDGATCAIPNDPSNGARALLLLQQAGLIKLKNGDAVDASITDITENRKNLKLVELDAAQIPLSLNDMDMACVNANYAIPAGLNPVKDALKVEDKNSPFVNVIAVRTEDKDNASYKKVVEIYQSDAIKKFIEEHFKGSILPAF